MAVPTPSVPASTTPVTNQTGQMVSVNITGGTISGATISFNTGLAPASTDFICVSYQK